MANPPHLFRVDGRLDDPVPYIAPWSVGVLDKVGSLQRSSYVEDFSLGNLRRPPCCLTCSVSRAGSPPKASATPPSPVPTPTRQDWRTRRLVTALGYPERTHVDGYYEQAGGRQR
jgi:hypothetical protein